MKTSIYSWHKMLLLKYHLQRCKLKNTFVIIDGNVWSEEMLLFHPTFIRQKCFLICLKEWIYSYKSGCYFNLEQVKIFYLGAIKIPQQLKGLTLTAWHPVFYPWDLNTFERRQTALQNLPLTSTHTQSYVHSISTHSHHKHTQKNYVVYSTNQL